MIINSNGYYETAAGLVLPKSARRPTAFDFFAGCGGFSLGFIQAGFEVVGMNEIDFSAMTTYCVNLSKQPLNMFWDTDKRGEELNEFMKKRIFNKNTNKTYVKHCRDKYYHESEKLTFPTLPGTGWILGQEIAGKYYPPVKNIFVADIRNLTGDIILERIGMKKGDLNCVIGGPPCQGYSNAGKQDINDPRNNLIFEYARMIVELQPKTFVMEEVPNIVNFRTPRGTFVLEEFGMILDQGDYMEFSQFCEAQKFVPKSNRFRKIKPLKNMGNNEKMIYEKKTITNYQQKLFN
ncbi:MAG: DNA cytosine methyltransferase [Prevotellaceae bacterium]|jgi:DNA (cytosine-5)-methyltransferase 1|nr:DNA cytosine methyltransferase [Prevotellaceae bacterium]